MVDDCLMVLLWEVTKLILHIKWLQQRGVHSKHSINVRCYYFLARSYYLIFPSQMHENVIFIAPLNWGSEKLSELHKYQSGSLESNIELFDSKGLLLPPWYTYHVQQDWVRGNPLMMQATDWVEASYGSDSLIWKLFMSALLWASHMAKIRLLAGSVVRWPLN